MPCMLREYQIIQTKQLVSHSDYTLVAMAKRDALRNEHDDFNPLRANFFRGNINIYLHFVSYLHIDRTKVVEILPQIRQESTYSW